MDSRRAKHGLPETGSTEDATADPKRDPDAFYRAHVGYVFTVLTRGFRFVNAAGTLGFHRVERAFDVEDLCQDTFAAFFHQLATGSYDADRPALPYLRRIAVNLALKRAGLAGREVSLEAAPEPAASEDRRVEQTELAQLMDEFRATLSEQERTVLQKYFDEDRISQSELGKALGLSRDQVYRLLCKVRQQAAVFFEAKGWFP